LDKRQVKINNVLFYISKGQNDFFWDNLESNKWEEQSFSVLDKFIKPGMLFIDIGCWEGPFSLYAASLGAIVHAIDPDEKAISELKKNIDLNPGLKQNIHIHQFAIACDNKQILLFERGRFGDSASSLMDRSRDTGNSYSVQGKTFEKFLKENNINHADFIKMDIEGGEFSLIPDIINGLEMLGFPPLLLAIHAVYLKENYMKRNNLLTKISRLNGKLSIAAGKIFANKFAKSEIIKLLEFLKCYKSVSAVTGNQDIFKELMHDGMVLFK